MKTYNLIVLFSLFVIVLTSCEHNVAMETTVHEDGSIDKVISFHGKDSLRDIQGLKESMGWKRKIMKGTKKDSGKEVTVEWKKSFVSVAEANAQLATPSDTLFRVSSTFEKKFRWFYTYIYYADTYHAINRMKLPIDDYLTPEDYAFIDRLPAEGKSISKADSLYLTELNKKLFDIYGLKAIFDEYFAANIDLITKYKLENRWIDSLSRHKHNLFQKMEQSKDVEDNFMLDFMDSLHVPLPYDKIGDEYKQKTKWIESKTNFISTANEGKYMNLITMPWTIVNTNADSIVTNNIAIWTPPVTKFLIKDFTMYAEARRLNYWAVAVSVTLIGFTFYLLFKKRNS